MFGNLQKFGMLFAGVVLCLSTTAPSIAADFHGHGGNVFYRGHYSGRFNGGAGQANNFHGGTPHWGGNRSGFEHRYFTGNRYDRGMTAQNGRWRHDNNERFGSQSFGNHLHGNRPRMLASRDLSIQRGSGISVIQRNQPDYDFISNYAGSTDVYQANGGTYVTGYGDGGGQDGSVQRTRPRSKMIDVSRMHDACSHENGVCVIRP